jgi:hypothetical protein
MKVLQVRENKPQQIMVLPTTAIKGVPKNGIIWAIEHVLYGILSTSNVFPT